MGRRKRRKNKLRGREKGPGTEIVALCKEAFFLDTSSRMEVPTHTHVGMIRIPMCLPE